VDVKIEPAMRLALRNYERAEAAQNPKLKEKFRKIAAQ
jgi:hypothetical protein